MGLFHDHETHRLLREILSALGQIHMDLTALQAAVAQETAVDQSVETLLTTLATELQAANANNDQPAIDAIVQTMIQNASTLGAAVTANTPAAPAPADTSTPPAGNTTGGDSPAGNTTA